MGTRPTCSGPSLPSKSVVHLLENDAVKERDRHKGGANMAGEVRLDVWLDVACLFPTRSQAAAACKGGKVDLNGRAGPPNRAIKVGDRLDVTLLRGKRTFVVKGVKGHHVPKAQARELYEETTPPPSAEVLETRRLERMLAPQGGEPSGKLSHRERREREQLRGR